MVIPIRPFVSELKCRLPNRISFDVFDRSFCKFEARACETLRSCAKRLGGLAVTILPGASRHLIRPWGTFTTVVLAVPCVSSARVVSVEPGKQ